MFPHPNPEGHVSPSLTVLDMFPLSNPAGYVSPFLTLQG